MQNGKTGSFLDEAFLKQLETIRILAQKGIKGKDTGIHRSGKGGSSLEFMDYRKYHPGDDVRYVDWNIYGRSDRLFIKRFHAEKDLTLHILVDTSLSMDTGTPSKYLYAQKIVAALSYIGLANQDQVGVTSFSDVIGKIKTPERGKEVYLSVLKYLTSLDPSGITDFNSSLQAFADSGRGPGVAVVVSDLLDPKGIKDGLKAVAHSKFKLTVIQVLDQEEISPLFSGSFLLQDIETGRSRNLYADKKLVERYADKMGDWLAEIQDFCKKSGIDYHLANTRISFEDFFLGFLGTGHMMN